MPNLTDSARLLSETDLPAFLRIRHVIRMTGIVRTIAYGPHLVLDPVVAYRQNAVADGAHQPRPAPETVIDCPGDG